MTKVDRYPAGQSQPDTCQTVMSILSRNPALVNSWDTSVAPVTLEPGFTYDANGLPATLSVPAGTSLNPNTYIQYSYDRDAFGRQSDMYTGPVQSPSWQVTNVSYNAAGQLAGHKLCL